MLQSKLFYKTTKEAPKEAEVVSQKLLTRAGFISQFASGIYGFLPLGFLVHKKIENIIREELNKIGCQEVSLPALQPAEIWKKSGRLEKMDPPLFRVKDRHDKEFVLGSTHEEVFTLLAKEKIQSYKDLPIGLYQIQDKFRNEMRFNGGLLRAREFFMKDLYSFHASREDLDNFFEKVALAYENIFKRCGLTAFRSEASGGVFTAEQTLEFQVLTDIGEDKIIYCEKCHFAKNLEILGNDKEIKCEKCGGKLKEGRSIELAHIFKLGDKYSKSFDLNFRDKDGQKKDVLMGCYGIGVGRLMATIVEMNNDDRGIIFPKEVAPFDAHLISLGDGDIKSAAEKIYNDLEKIGKQILFDDRDDKTFGEKFAEADLIGIPLRIVLSEKTFAENSVEIKNRKSGKIELVKIESLPEIFV